MNSIKEKLKDLYDQIKTLKKENKPSDDELLMEAKTFFNDYHLRGTTVESIPSSVVERYRLLYDKKDFHAIIDLYCNYICAIVDDNITKHYTIIRKEDVDFLVISDNARYVLIPKKGKSSFIKKNRTLILEHICSLFLIFTQIQRDNILDRFKDDEKTTVPNPPRGRKRKVEKPVRELEKEDERPVKEVEKEVEKPVKEVEKEVEKPVKEVEKPVKAVESASPYKRQKVSTGDFDYSAVNRKKEKEQSRFKQNSVFDDYPGEEKNKRSYSSPHHQYSKRSLECPIYEPENYREEDSEEENEYTFF